MDLNRISCHWQQARTQLDLSSTSSTTVGELSLAGLPLEPVALHVPDSFLALNLKNLHFALDDLHLHNLFLSLHHGVHVRNVQVLGVVQQREP